jgi:hypothetical protein
MVRLPYGMLRLRIDGNYHQRIVCGLQQGCMQEGEIMWLGIVSTVL